MKSQKSVNFDQSPQAADPEPPASEDDHSAPMPNSTGSEVKRYFMEQMEKERYRIVMRIYIMAIAFHQSKELEFKSYESQLDLPPGTAPQDFGKDFNLKLSDLLDDHFDQYRANLELALANKPSSKSMMMKSQRSTRTTVIPDDWLSEEHFPNSLISDLAKTEGTIQHHLELLDKIQDCPESIYQIEDNSSVSKKIGKRAIVDFYVVLMYAGFDKNMINETIKNYITQYNAHTQFLKCIEGSGNGGSRFNFGDRRELIGVVAEKFANSGLWTSGESAEDGW
jgi:hypothetical protein